MVKKFPGEIKKGDMFKSPTGLIYICTEAFFGLSMVAVGRVKPIKVVKKKLPKDAAVIRRITLTLKGGAYLGQIFIIHMNQANKPKWLLKQGFRIIDKNGYIRGGQHVKLKKI